MNKLNIIIDQNKEIIDLLKVIADVLVQTRLQDLDFNQVVTMTNPDTDYVIYND